MKELNNYEDARLPRRIVLAMLQLLEAIEYAEQSRRSVWDFAIEIELFQSLGLKANDWRWLTANRLVEHMREVTEECESQRSFQPTGEFSFPARSCFVLSAKGIGAARRLLLTESVESESISEQLFMRTSFAGAIGSSSKMRPDWNPERRILRFDGKVVKVFKWAAENQEAILSAFEEEGWPPRIDDPLHPQPGIDSKRRLGDTIKCLNRKQLLSLLHFRGDGTGEGVIWDASASA